MKITYGEKVKQENITSRGTLQSGVYEVSFKEFLTLAPILVCFDGHKWFLSDSYTDGYNMFVHERIGDYGLKEKFQSFFKAKTVINS